ncbi:MAG: hypothetical protein AAGB10_21700, partial [Pseudomonadota bacterium]
RDMARPTTIMSPHGRVWSISMLVCGAGVRNVSDVDLQAVNLSTFQPFAEGCGKGLDGLKVWIAAGQANARSGSSENTRF